MVVGNWVDWIIVAVIGYYTLKGWQSGVLYLATNLVVFLISLWAAIRSQMVVGGFLNEKFGIGEPWSGVVGYVVVALIIEMVLSVIADALLKHLPHQLVQSKINRFLGLFLGFLNGAVLVTFFVVLLSALPLRGTIRQDISASVLSIKLLALTGRYAGSLRSAIDEARPEVPQFPGFNGH